MFEVVKIKTHTDDISDVLKINNTSDKTINYTFGNILPENSEYTFSCWMKCDKVTDTTVTISNKTKTFHLNNTWTRIIFSSLADISVSKIVKFSIPVGATIYAHQGQLEYGNKATSFKLNLLDIKETADNAMSTAEQTANKFSWLVKSGTSETNFELTDRTAQLVANNINLKGLVTFSGLGQDAKDKISNAENKATEADKKVSNIKIGGKNLLSGAGGKEMCTTHNEWLAHNTTCTDEIYNGSYVYKANKPWAGLEFWFKDVADRANLKAGDELTISIKVKTDDLTHTDGIFLVSSYSDNSATGMGCSTNQFEAKPPYTDWVTLSHTFTYTKQVEDKLNSGERVRMGFEIMMNPTSDGKYYYFSCLKLEKGNKVTDWTPSPDDKANQSIIDSWSKAGNIVEGVTTINGGYIQTNTIKTEQLVVDEIFSSGSAVMNKISAMELNADMITAGTIRAKLLNLYGLQIFNSVNEKETFSVSATGDVTMRGTVESYNYKSGQSGWSIKNDGNAEFNDVVVRGSLITETGGVVGNTRGFVRVPKDQKNVIFWAGSSFENRESAPFIVYSDGSIKSAKGNYNGLWTGDIKVGNITISDPSGISGGDALLEIRNGNNGVKQVQLTDGQQSNFAQNIVITNNAYEQSIALKQDGTGIFSNGVYVNDKYSLSKDGLVLDGSNIRSTSNGLELISSMIHIGSTGYNANLTVHGNLDIREELKIDNKLSFKDKAIITIVDGGIDINITT